MDTSPQITRLTPAARAILDAAGRMFYEQGIGAVGVDAIAAEAGVTKKTLYDQFRSKAALVVRYLDERDRHFRDWVMESADASVGTGRILAAFDALDSWMDAHSPAGCAFVHAHGELIGSPEHPAHEVIRAEKRWFREFFLGLASDVGCQDPQEVAMQMVSLLEGAKVVRSISGSSDAVVASRRAAAVILDSKGGQR